MSIIAEKISKELTLPVTVVERVITMIDEGATIPFLVRYRQEATGGLSEEDLGRIHDALLRLLEIASRKEVILQTIQEQNRMTEELKQKILACDSRPELEDLFLPFKPKPVTRATKAEEAGLAPLADLIMTQGNPEQPLSEIVAPFVNEEKGVPDEETAWAGARDICADRIAMIPELRRAVRKLMKDKGNIVARLADGIDADRAQKYREFQNFSEPVRQIHTNRVFALRRGEKEGFITVRVTADKESALALCRQHALKNLDTPFLDSLETAVEDAWERLIAPSIEGEVRNQLRDQADEEAIETISNIVRQHLMTPPFGKKRVLGIAADERKGGRAALIDENGQLLEDAAFNMGEPGDDSPGPASVILRLAETYKPEAVAIGKNTPGRDVETLIREMIRQEKLPKMPVVMLTEAEAGVYAGGPIAREEFPDKDGQCRRAASFARRFQDPLAEQLKIDPRAIGSTPYHHDVDRSLLLDRLERTVTSCTSAVGVDVNLASRRHLTCIAGTGPQIGANIAKFREEHGPFRTRSAFHQVKKMTPRAFEQCCAFLKVNSGDNALDTTRVHPERYALVAKMAEDIGTDIAGLLADPAKRAQIELSRYIDENVGEPTLTRLLADLSDGWKDVRGEYTPMEFDPNVSTLGDLKPGMKLPGVVTNVTDFGAFVDVGVQHEGLVHLSQLSYKRVLSPYELVTVGQCVTVAVTEVDLERQRLSLSIKAALPKPERPERPRRIEKPAEGAEAQPRSPRPERQERPRPTERRDRPAGPPQDRPADRPPSQDGRRDMHPRGGDGRAPRRDGEGFPPRREGGDRPQRPPRDDRRPERDRPQGPRPEFSGQDRRPDTRPPQQGGGRNARSDRDNKPKRQQGPEGWRPFAALKIVNGQIVMEPEEEKKPKEKK